MSWYDRDQEFDDEDARREAIDERRARARQRCQCAFEMPGTCPGPENCPMCQDEDDEEGFGG